MSYLFVDRILKIQENPEGVLQAKGLKAVSRWEPYVRPGPDGVPELSPCFAGEAVGQLAAWAAMARLRFARRPVAGITAEVLVGGAARPGEVILLEAEIDSVEEDAVHYHGRAEVRGREILSLRDVVGPMLQMEDFDDPREVEREYARLLAPAPAEAAPHEEGPRASGGSGSLFEGSPRSSGGSESIHPLIDEILEESAERIAAATCVPRAAPYLQGHFPRNPVLPATLLLDSQVSLAARLAAGGERGAAGGRPRPVRLRDLKMRDFVRPGTRLVSEVRIRERKSGRVIAEILARAGDRTISSGLVELAAAGAGGKDGRASP